ncbi:hypothetical protein H2198_010735 [Neophaeococcomyces mojaviensis]|uniref:Uncharacterized protein n=1 Tax=Neophaeococcomyces mojaviensis TaxID=3383035 RepID=A0ACC2ZQP1_9EURO|nr:hypothetical protein H2198_010735 [Knufia sp. JES_112]
MPSTEREPDAKFWRTFLWSQWMFTPPYPTQSWTGKTVIVTGSNVGLGFEAAQHFARLGAEKVILATRNLSAAEKARSSIEQSTGCGLNVVECWPLDLCSYASVKKFAARCGTLPRLDCLLENAGITGTTYRKVELDEIQITVNVVSTFLLGLQVLPILKETAAKYNTRTHLTIVTSEMHHQASLKERFAVKAGKHASLLEALDDPKTAVMTDRYQVSKLLEIFFLRELTSTIAGEDYPVAINCVNPGFCRSSLLRDFAGVAAILNVLLHARQTEIGSRTLVQAASAGPESHGQYLSNCKVALVSNFVRSDEGRQVQKQVYKDIVDRLENIQPGIMQNV